MIRVQFMYTNYKGEKRLRTLDVEELVYHARSMPEYNYEPGWFLCGFDPEKNARRSFALSNIDVSDLKQTSHTFTLPLRYQ